MIRLSVVVPVFNEEAVIEACYQRLTQTLSQLGDPYEIIWINDGSRDRTASMLREICRGDSACKMISFSRNFGHQTAITAGMDHTRGDAVVVIDADLQDPPEVILQMVAKWREGYEVVYGRRVRREGETVFKKATARGFYRLLQRLSAVDIPVDTGDFRLLDRRVVKALATLPEHNRYVRGLVSWLGFRQTFVDYVRAPRLAGTTKYPLRKMLRLAWDGISSFSYKPLRLGLGVGIFLSVCSFLFLFFIVIARLTGWIWMQIGWASMMSVMLFFFGIVLIMLSIIGEYIGRIFEEVKGRPLYIIADREGDLGPSLRDAAQGRDQPDIHEEEPR